MQEQLRRLGKPNLGFFCDLWPRAGLQPIQSDRRPNLWADSSVSLREYVESCPDK